MEACPIRSNIVTDERQLHVLDEIRQVHRSRGVATQCERKSVPAGKLIATQNAIEADKYRVVKHMVEQGELDIPVIVEQHFIDGRDRYYLIDGHCRSRASIDLGKRVLDAYVLWSPAGDFPSNFVNVAEEYGNVLVRDLPMVEPDAQSRPV